MVKTLRQAETSDRITVPSQLPPVTAGEIFGQTQKSDLRRLCPNSVPGPRVGAEMDPPSGKALDKAEVNSLSFHPQRERSLP